MDENDQFSSPPKETAAEPFLASSPQPYMPYGYHAEQPAAFSPYPFNDTASPAAFSLPSYEAVRKTAARSGGAAKAAFVLGMVALFFLAFWLIYPPAGLIMTLLSLAVSLIGLRLGRRARRETLSNLAEAGYMLNVVGLAASGAFCLLGIAACVGLVSVITAFL